MTPKKSYQNIKEADVGEEEKREKEREIEREGEKQSFNTGLCASITS
jgi:hypothetical protein